MSAVRGFEYGLRAGYIALIEVCTGILMQTVADSADITKQVWQIIDKLPQREAILEGDARFWVQEVVAAYGDLAIWHAIRAGGFGGSQIGALVRNHNGQRADHEASAHNIVEGALLRRLPDEPNGHMRRGTAMEERHRPWFYEKHNAQRDAQGFTILSKNTGPCPWMRYSPDDLVFMPTQAGRERWLIDFKAPSVVDQSEAVSFQYVCQLHMGRLVCEHNGVGIDGLLLSQFDWANWQLKDDVVGYLPELDSMITAAGDYYWDFVLRGQVPPYVHKERLDVDVVPETVREAAGRLARLKAIASALEKKIEAVEQAVKPALEKLKFGGARLPLNGISFSAVPKPDEDKIRAQVPEAVLAAVPLIGGRKRYDDEKMVKKLRELEVDMTQFVKPASMDNDVLYGALCAHGFDADALMGEQVRGTVDKKLTAEAIEWVEREFADLIQAPAQTSAIEEAGGAQNDRDGHETQRQVPRSVVA
ncbi:hypothetical protein [Ramlibacter sp. AN1133]|uniref:hypothetical protein n=1 Tax=Ramlibacter sp. AN1133 TaxID=3133429 RepID=UPI0030BBA6FB